MNGRFTQLVQLPRRVLSLLLYGSERIQQVAADARRVSKIGARAAEKTSEIGKHTRKVESEVGALTKDMRTLTSELHQLRDQLNDRLLQYNLQLGRLSRIATTDDERHAAGNGGASD